MSRPFHNKKAAGQRRYCSAVFVFLLLIAVVLLSLNPALSPAYAQSSEIEYLRNQAETIRTYAENQRNHAKKRRSHAKQYQDNAEEARRLAKKSKRKIDKDSYLDDASMYDKRAENAALDADNAEARAAQAEAELVQLLKTLERSPAEETADTSPSKSAVKEDKPKYPAIPQKQTVPVQTEKFPPHMVNMAAQLYKGMGDELKGEHLTSERRKVLEKSVKTMREMKMHNWSAKPVKVKNGSAGIAEKLGLDQEKLTDRILLKNFMETKALEGTAAALKKFTVKTKRQLSDEEAYALATEIDAAYGKAFEALGKNYRVTTDDGHAVQMKWNPDAGKFLMKVFDDGKSDGEEFASSFSGDVKTALSDNGKDITLDTTPAQNPVQVMTATDIEVIRSNANILGEWQTEDGTIYIFSAAAEKAGEVRPPREFFDKQIEQLKEKAETIKNTKIFEWQNTKTLEIVRQKKLRKLKEPFDWIGEKYALENAEEEIAALETKITELEAERDGATLPPVKRFDPAGYKEMKASEGARTITVHVTRPNGYSYSYDEAAFDGRRITARRTYKTVEDFTNQKLPTIIKQRLIRDGWEPPGWLELEASVDVETGDLLLEGLRWSGHVTYSSFFGSPGEISSIHTPYSSALRLEGFKLSSITITDETFRNELQKVMPGGRFWISAKGSVGNSDIVDRVRVSVYPEEAEESEWIEVELVETGLDTLEFHSSPEGILVTAAEEEEDEEEGSEIIEPEPPVGVAGEEDEEGEGLPSASSYDPETGITTKSQGNPDGSRTVTKTDKDGNVISKKTLPPRGKVTPSANSTDEGKLEGAGGNKLEEVQKGL